MRAADRVRLPVPLERIPTVYPFRDARKGKTVSDRFRGLLKRMRAALRTQALLDSDYPRSHGQDDFLHPKVNPATGLLMIGSVDAAGNPYGFDLHAARHRFDSAQVVTHLLWVGVVYAAGNPSALPFNRSLGTHFDSD